MHILYNTSTESLQDKKFPFALYIRKKIVLIHQKIMQKSEHKLFHYYSILSHNDLMLNKSLWDQ